MTATNRVKVWNDNTADLRDTWRGQDIFIPAGEFIEMDHGDAVLYMGEYKAPVYTADGADKAEGFKKLRKEPIPDAVEEEEQTDWACQACGFNARSKWELEGHVSDLHVDQIADPKVAEKMRGKKKG